MKKIITAAILGSVILGLVIYLFISFKPDPPLETKFVTTKDGVVEDQYTNPTVSDIQITEPGDSALVANPNHIYQTFNNCGPATLSMILSWYGVSVSQGELGNQMRPYQVASGDNDDKTIFTYEFVDWAKKYGFEAVGRINGDIDLLKTFTANGIPVVVKTWLHPGEDIGHFRIVRGFNDTKGVIIQDDSYEGPNKSISYYDFLSMWQPFNYSYIVVYTKDESKLVEAIIGAEMNEDVAWTNALDRAKVENQKDPESVYPIFNMVTSYYHLGEFLKSTVAFESVEDRLPRRMLWYQIEPILAYQELGNDDRVFEITDRILDNGNRAFSELYQIRGEIYLDDGDNERAREEFEKAVQYNKNYEPAIKALSSISD